MWDNKGYAKLNVSNLAYLGHMILSRSVLRGRVSRLSKVIEVILSSRGRGNSTVVSVSVYQAGDLGSCPP